MRSLHAAGVDIFARIALWSRGEPLLLTMLGLNLVLGVVDPRPFRDWLQWLDMPTLASLLALLVVAQGIRTSGLVQKLARHMLRFMTNRRTLVLVLMGLAAVSAMLLTNDVSLFLILPLTLALCEGVALPRVRVVVLVALAVNAGAALSPIGNPQNLMLWRASGAGMGHFVAAMAPTVAIMLLVLLAATWWLVKGGALHPIEPPQQGTRLDVRLGGMSLVLLLVLLGLLQMNQVWWALVLVLVVFGWQRPRVIGSVDWTLLASIALMLMGLGHLVEIPFVRAWLGQLDWGHPSVVYVSGIVLSQAISNVPATVALLHRAPDPMHLAMAVNIGGSGLAIGSLANLIALRLEGSRRIWRTFHLISVPYLLVVATLAWWLL